MLFNSFQFAVFLPFVVAFYFLLPHRFRWMMLLAASYYFYMCWKMEYIILILVSTLIDYVAGLQMERSTRQGTKRLFLLLSLFTNLGLLFAFKYFNFFSASARAAFNAFNIFYDMPMLKVLLPVGISFYTFQTLSYSIDVYRGDKKAEHHLGIFALYVAFFPQLVAGPIERSTQLLPQFYEKHYFDYRRVTDGLKLILWGFFKKIVIADRLAVVVNQVYNNVDGYTGIPLLIATYFFAFQIYCDFSGYSDIAIGTAQMMGFDLMDNFKRPYFARSISTFWKRWHISLSTWFRDYLYIPLGGNRVSRTRLYFNLMVVFVLSGLWHGANWTYVVWGAIHGFYLLFEVSTENLRRGIRRFFRLHKHHMLKKLVRVFITFHLVTFAWIFFRANSLSDALYIVQHLFCRWTLHAGGYGLGLGTTEFIVAVLSIAFMEFVHVLQRHRHMRQFLSMKPIWIRWPVYYAIIFMILILGKFDTAEFIYFQF